MVSNSFLSPSSPRRAHRFLVKQSSHFLQAHAFLNLHIIHSSQAPTGGPQADGDPAAAHGTANLNLINPDNLHPNLGPAGFRIYSPLTNPHTQGPGSMMSNGDLHSSMSSSGPPEFSAMQLLKVMSRLSAPETHYLPYFHLCRELGVRAVDGMIKGRVLDLRWTETVTREVGEEMRVRSAATPIPAGTVLAPLQTRYSGNAGMGVISSESSNMSPVLGPPPPINDEEMMVPVSGSDDIYEEIMEVVGPKLVPITPIMRFAMREVVQEYEDDQSISEYASLLSDVDEY